MHEGGGVCDELMGNAHSCAGSALTGLCRAVETVAVDGVVLPSDRGVAIITAEAVGL